jgi:hypothetical protein
LFRFLALHPGPDASTAALAGPAGLSRRATEDLPAELTGAHLLTEHVPGRSEDCLAHDERAEGMYLLRALNHCDADEVQAEPAELDPPG